MNYTAVAHLTEGGDPTATLFTNDTAPLAAGQGRLTVRHVAAAPAVDVLAGGSPVIYRPWPIRMKPSSTSPPASCRRRWRRPARPTP